MKALEVRLGAPLFRRLPRGLALTDEGQALLPELAGAFDRIAGAVERFDRADGREIVTLGAVGTFAAGWLLPRMAALAVACPGVDLRLSTNNNRVDIAEEGLDFAVRFGDGAWHGIESDLLFEAPLTPLCDPATAARLKAPADLAAETLLRSYRANDWPEWFRLAGGEAPRLHGPVFDSSALMVEAARHGFGVALAPARMFERALAAGEVARPFAEEVPAGSYWLTRLKTKTLSSAMAAFRGWILAEAEAS